MRFEMYREGRFGEGEMSCVFLDNIDGELHKGPSIVFSIDVLAC
jgi:hypothetical protein